MPNLGRTLIYSALVLLSVAVLFVVGVYLTRAIGALSMQPLKAEHRAEFAQEFRAKWELQTDWQAYLEAEGRLSAEANRIFFSRPSGHDRLDRHAAGSVSNPDEHSVNWNRSYRLAAPANKGAAVLVHGLSDSPYSLRAVAELMQSKGITAYVPRMPGHGFAVGDLRHANWEDWMAAIRIAMRAANAELSPGQPLFLAGYSNGGLLATRYALDCGARDDMPCPVGILLLSPAIDVSAFARLSGWHKAISWMQTFEQFQWETVMPEVDPYKFTSFPKNPGRELFRAARQVARDLESVPVDAPALLAFQSSVDDTVSTDAVIKLFKQWPANGSELVLYDVNRSNQTATLMVPPPVDIVGEIESGRPFEFAVTVVTNISADSTVVQAVHYDSSDSSPARQKLNLEWPATVFSLSHVAIPFRPDDPVYGARPATNGLNLGGIAPKGERKVLSLSPSYFARLRYNPFYAYQEDRISAWVDRWLSDKAP